MFTKLINAHEMEIKVLVKPVGKLPLEDMVISLTFNGLGEFQRGDEEVRVLTATSHVSKHFDASL